MIPEGYKENALGHLVPIGSIEAIDLLRDELVQDLAERAAQLHKWMLEFKRAAMDDVREFVSLSAEKYDVQVGGLKGNLILNSFDGRVRVAIQVQERIAFDERIKIAKELVDHCIQKWMSGSTDINIRALVEHAFQVDKTGRINIGRVIGLTKLKIDDEDWKKAMEAIRDSLQVLGSTSYIRFYRRREDGEYTQIPLDLSAL